MDLTVGDRVVCIKAWMRDNIVGQTGTVVRAEKTDVGVAFDKRMGGHDLGGACEPGYGWWIPTAYVNLIDDAPEVPVPCFDGLF